MGVLVFFYDILIYSKEMDEHIKTLEEVLQILREHKLFAKKTKCAFGVTQIEYLGGASHYSRKGNNRPEQDRSNGLIWGISIPSFFSTR